MFMLIFTLPFWGLELLAPVVIWIMAPRWHPVLAILYVALAIPAGFHVARTIRRARAEHQARAARRPGWKWSRQLTAEAYGARLALFLRLRGWRIEASAVTPRDRVELVLRRERLSLILLCLAPHGPPPDAADWQRLSEARTEFGASAAAIVTAAPVTAPEGIRQLRFASLAHLEEA